MPETCRDIYDNKSRFLHQVGTFLHFSVVKPFDVAGIALLLQRFATIWKVRDSKHGESEIIYYSTPIHFGVGSHQVASQMSIEALSRRFVTNDHLAQRF